jgi:hypothetical protein
LIEPVVAPDEDDIRPGWDARTNDSHMRTKSHLTTFETYVQDINMDAKIIDGWFKAPKSG